MKGAMRMLLPLLLVLGCIDGKGYECDTSTLVDADGDSWPAAPEDCLYLLPTDCDDDNPEIHSFAEEACNGVDDDCDEKIDEECPTTT